MIGKNAIQVRPRVPGKDVSGGVSLCAAGIVFAAALIFTAGTPLAYAQNVAPEMPSEKPAIMQASGAPEAGPVEQNAGKEGAASALPPGGDVKPRSPGMELPLEATFSSSPAMLPAVVQKTAEQTESEIRDQAFNAAITGLLPLNPGEIRKLLERFDKTQQAVEVPIHPYPEPEVMVENVSLDPGSKPPEVKVAIGHVTTLTILDATGAPWPIMDMSWGGNFEIVTPGQPENNHIIRIAPTSEFAYGNLSVVLQGLKTPLTFILKTHRDSVHYRLDARVAAFGPNAATPLIDGGLTLVAGSSAMNAILDGMPPQGAEKLIVDGVDGRTTAYRYDRAVYVRTPLTLLSPGWSGSASSADGMNVYTVANASVLLLSDRGRMVRANLSAGDNPQ